MESIKQKTSSPATPALPDFRNLGLVLRALLLVNALALATAVIGNVHWQQLPAALLALAARVELPLLVVLSLLYVLAPRWRHWPAWLAQGLVFVLVAVVVSGLAWFGGGPQAAGSGLFRQLLWALSATALCLFYFRCREQRLSPALAEARVQALSARIRPHFLFNSLNAVLGVMRSEPRRAEDVLEALAELFRVLMRDHRELVSLADELALCEGYLDIERLRLGERLQLRWQLPAAGSEERATLLAVKVPGLLLQPLLENAVYHGIEPAADGGEIIVSARRVGDQLLLEVDNPLGEEGSAGLAAHHQGNHMALDNIRERLMLFFDLEASLDIERSGGRHRVRIRLPWRQR